MTTLIVYCGIEMENNEIGLKIDKFIDSRNITVWFKYMAKLMFIIPWFEGLLLDYRCNCVEISKNHIRI